MCIYLLVPDFIDYCGCYCHFVTLGDRHLLNDLIHCFERERQRRQVCRLAVRRQLFSSLVSVNPHYYGVSTLLVMVLE